MKDKLLFQLTNFGEPFIHVEDANYDNRGELLLRHRHEGIDLQVDHARGTIGALGRIWRRPVNLLTVVDGKQKVSASTARTTARRRWGPEAGRSYILIPPPDAWLPGRPQRLGRAFGQPLDLA